MSIREQRFLFFIFVIIFLSLLHILHNGLNVNLPVQKKKVLPGVSSDISTDMFVFSSKLFWLWHDTTNRSSSISCWSETGLWKQWVIFNKYLKLQNNTAYMTFQRTLIFKQNIRMQRYWVSHILRWHTLILKWYQCVETEGLFLINIWSYKI